ncbi:thiol-disulfide oxidoreductase DCC family protein [uncultured Enterovirga sp.]|uniref:thiol-disulfide oxidoreductase DCC family protein n=1 Tax=uncultured Enterovirga sp. TaxID=2026352 RepID=UPI0035C9D156
MSEALRARLPPEPLIVFDGECVLCSRSAQFVLRHDRARHFRLTTAQGEVGQAIYRELDLSVIPGLAQREPGTYGSAGETRSIQAERRFSTMLLVHDGEVATESDAVLGIGAGLGPPWRWLAAAGRIAPPAIRDRAYRRVARNRYRWFGRRETCWMPGPGDRDRIL